MPADGRVKDKFLLRVIENTGGCLYCDDPALVPLEGSGSRLGLLFCEKHVRWAMAARRERYGKQARTLQRLLLAHCRVTGSDPGPVKEWLGF